MPFINFDPYHLDLQWPIRLGGNFFNINIFEIRILTGILVHKVLEEG